MNEQELIHIVAGAFRRNEIQKNRLFECDSEIIELKGGLWALSLDQFSPGEDLFTSEDPERLGKNLVSATLSDLFAVGAVPKVFVQGLTVPRDADAAFVRGMAKGVNDALVQVGCAMVGGDMGTEPEWRYTGFAMGPVRSNRPLTRVIPDGPQSLWVTGEFGDANLSAFLGTPTPLLELRYRESEAIHPFATACMDTSGGLFEALWWFRNVRPRARFRVDLDRIPVASGIAAASIKSGTPVEAFFLGGAGEYELLFALPEPISEAATRMVGKIKATRIGTVDDDTESAVIHIHRGDREVAIMNEAPPCPRVSADRNEYIQLVIRAANAMAGGNARP